MQKEADSIFNCQVCSRLAHRKAIVAFLFRRLKMEKFRSEGKLIPLVMEGEGQGFRQIIKILFSHDLVRGELTCDHSKFYEYFCVDKGTC